MCVGCLRASHQYCWVFANQDNKVHSRYLILTTIAISSPITHTISSAARGIIQTILATFLLGEILTMYRVLGISITCVGTCLYTWIRSYEHRRERSRGENKGSLSKSKDGSKSSLHVEYQRKPSTINNMASGISTPFPDTIKMLKCEV